MRLRGSCSINSASAAAAASASRSAARSLRCVRQPSRAATACEPPAPVSGPSNTHSPDRCTGKSEAEQKHPLFWVTRQHATWQSSVVHSSTHMSNSTLSHEHCRWSCWCGSSGIVSHPPCCAEELLPALLSVPRKRTTLKGPARRTGTGDGVEQVLAAGVGEGGACGEHARWQALLLDKRLQLGFQRARLAQSGVARPRRRPLQKLCYLSMHQIQHFLERFSAGLFPFTGFKSETRSGPGCWILC